MRKRVSNRTPFSFYKKNHEMCRFSKTQTFVVLISIKQKSHESGSSDPNLRGTKFRYFYKQFTLLCQEKDFDKSEKLY